MSGQGNIKIDAVELSRDCEKIASHILAYFKIKEC